MKIVRVDEEDKNRTECCDFKIEPIEGDNYIEIRYCVE
ncbi:MAG: hypothetical protein A4E53_00833 [Pelotomaculum sp. PtaB.Bin104]|nr:MAG: hypothetical protein A4E53_00833 [Pelotomaculum sp. PtaB.Bin104]